MIIWKPDEKRKRNFGLQKEIFGCPMAWKDNKTVCKTHASLIPLNTHSKEIQTVISRKKRNMRIPIFF